MFASRYLLNGPRLFLQSVKVLGCWDITLDYKPLLYFPLRYLKYLVCANRHFSKGFRSDAIQLFEPSSVLPLNNTKQYKYQQQYFVVVHLLS